MTSNNTYIKYALFTKCNDNKHKRGCVGCVWGGLRSDQIMWRRPLLWFMHVWDGFRFADGDVLIVDDGQ